MRPVSPGRTLFGVRLVRIGLHLSKQQLNAIRGPRRDAGSEEIRIFRPDRTFQGQRRREYRPVFFITFLQTLPRCNLKWPVNLGIDAADQHC